MRVPSLILPSATSHGDDGSAQTKIVPCDTVSELDAGDRDRRVRERFESGHRRTAPFDGAVVAGAPLDTQAAGSGYRGYNAHGGLTAAGLGFSATHFITHGWLINAEVAVNRLLGSASDSPITQSSFQGIVELTTAYQW
jgi:hypothetical protein